MKGKGNSRNRRQANYETVDLEGLQKTRRGKHHDFVGGVLEDLEGLKSGSAIKIPLTDVKGVSVLKLRAALNRACAAKGIRISTSSDSENFYVWAAAAKKAGKN